MEYKGIKINIVILIILIVLMLFFSAKFVLQRYNVEKPLVAEISAIEGIKEVTLSENNDKTDLVIKFNSNINLFSVYQNITELCDRHLGSDFGKLIIINNSNQKLDEIYYKLHFAIYESISKGNFTEMKEEFNRITEAEKISKHSIWVDREHIYIKLIDNTFSLYKIVPRGGEHVG